MIGTNYHFGFIGLGLIGGSIARALKNVYPDCTDGHCTDTFPSAACSLAELAGTAGMD